MLFNDSKFAGFVAENFVGVASDDVAYHNLPDAAKLKREYQFLESSLMNGVGNVRQGVYAVTSSGKFLAKIDTGWPTYDVAASLDNLISAVKKYKSLAKAERVQAVAMTEVDRSMPALGNLGGEGILKMRTMARSYAFPEMELFDQRHPTYSKLDAFWISPDEVKSLVPDAKKRGEKSYVSQSLVERMLLHSQPMEGCGGWWKEHILKQKIEVSISHKKGSEVFLLYHGDLVMSADSKWNKSEYLGRFLGKGVWDEKLQKITRLEWVTLGERNLKELKSNMHRGSTKKTKIASYMRLARKVKEEQSLLPHHWDHYPQTIKQP
ncbi:MAG: hypothetical protein ABGY95_00330 [Rubritalea sp.]|uniref:hypothetical protein n=1 Tax=Rubritalea sp. TaxID=2109375 RepID=UPI003242564D